MGWFGLACIFSTMVTIDGPLLQRSTHVIAAPISGEFVTLNVTIAPELPRYFGGNWTTTTAMNMTGGWLNMFNQTIPTINGTASNKVYPMVDRSFERQAVPNYLRDTPLLNVVRGCPGTCKAILRAPALAHTCERHLLPVNYSRPASSSEYDNVNALRYAPPMDRLLFGVGSSLVEGVDETISLASLTDSASIHATRVTTTDHGLT